MKIEQIMESNEITKDEKLVYINLSLAEIDLEIKTCSQAVFIETLKKEQRKLIGLDKQIKLEPHNG